MRTPKRLAPSPVTRKLQIFTAGCSLIFAVGSALHGFAVVDTGLIEDMMRLAGGADPAGDAPGFTTGFRIVGTVYILGNALGVLALYSRSRALYWWILAVNVTQALGWVMIPAQMWTVVNSEYGIAGILPSAVTDGGAVIVSLVLLGALVAFRAPWAQRRVLEP